MGTFSALGTRASGAGLLYYFSSVALFESEDSANIEWLFLFGVVWHAAQCRVRVIRSGVKTRTMHDAVPVDEGPDSVEDIGMLLASRPVSDGVHFSQLEEADIPRDQFRIELADRATVADCQLPRQWILALALTFLMCHSRGRWIWNVGIWLIVVICVAEQMSPPRMTRPRASRTFSGLCRLR
ncbi:hypothetical protein F4824DRAFT_186277 [Ustulina deusta]|nr:hypothetical protein F4824DRAFT_186277 [Ustulina deusta]